MRSAFLDKWHKRSSFTWKQLAQHQRHGLGSEFIPSSQIEPAIPRQFQDVENLEFFAIKETCRLLVGRMGPFSTSSGLKRIITIFTTTHR